LDWTGQERHVFGSGGATEAAGDGVSGGVVFLIVEDVDELHMELVAKGVQIAMEPTDQSWGNREMYVADADGNSIRFVREGGG
jgi:uncharacterized glyoxalase superfamily protein PhnB